MVLHFSISSAPFPHILCISVDHSDADNPVVYCESCNVGAHSFCYGSPLSMFILPVTAPCLSLSLSLPLSLTPPPPPPFICTFLPVIRVPEGPWICELCRWNARDQKCVLCGQGESIGAMKRTTDFRWAHLSCSLWVPEVFFRNGEAREPIDIMQIPRRRWNQVCCHCNEHVGACIECSFSNCKKTFHVTCGLQHDISLEYNVKSNGADVILSYCTYHAKKIAKR
jgi:NuA3 HAT complex component NTO1